MCSSRKSSSRAWLTMTCGNSESRPRTSWTRPKRLMPRRGPPGRAPEPGLVDPVRLAHHRLGETEGLERLDGAAVHAVGPADLQRAVAPLHDAGDDLRELRQLGREQQAGRAGADDEDVDLVWELGGACERLSRGGPEVGISGSVSVSVELHGRLRGYRQYPNDSTALNKYDVRGAAPVAVSQTPGRPQGVRDPARAPDAKRWPRFTSCTHPGWVGSQPSSTRVPAFEVGLSRPAKVAR